MASTRPVIADPPGRSAGGPGAQRWRRRQARSGPAPGGRRKRAARALWDRGRHLRLPRARRGALPGPGRPGPGAAAALACAAARRHRQLPDRRRARYRVGQLAVHDPGTLADRGAARGVAGRGRLRHGSPPPHRARRGTGRAERLLPGPAFPALPHRRGPGRRRLPRRRHRGAAGGADPRPGRHRPGRGPERDAGGSRAGRAGRRGPGRCGAAGARRGRSRPVHRAGRRCAGAPLPPPRSCPSRAQGPRRHRDDHQAAAPARPAGDRSRPPASPVHRRRIHARVHHRARPRDAVRPRARAAGAGPDARVPAAAPGPGLSRR